MTRVVDAAVVGISSLEAIFDFLGELVHGWIRTSARTHGL